MSNISRIVLIGNANSTFIKGYIKYVLIKFNCSITLITETNTLFKDFYLQYGVNVIVIRDDSIIEKIKGLRTVRYILKVCKTLRNVKCDLIIVHSAWCYLLYVLPYLELQSKLVLTFWGSDLLRTPKKRLLLAKKAIMISDRIVVLTKEMYVAFLKIFGQEFSNKIEIIDFGVSVFDIIDSIENSNFSKKEFLGVECEKGLVITVGYNASEQQQHIKVTKELSKIDKNIKKNIFILYPMTYPEVRNHYREEVAQVAHNNCFKFLILKDYLDEFNIAKLCCVTDIFIHAQTTDALSTSMLEQIYSGSIVLNGQWLKYDFLDQIGVKFERFKMNELADMVEDIITKEHAVDKVHNKKVLKENCSWDKCFLLWKKLFDSL